MSATLGTVVVLAVVGLRFLVPLAVPRYPLPAIVAALVLNSVASACVAGRGAQWPFTAAQLVGVLAINTVIVLALVVLPTPGGASVDVPSALLFLLLLSLLVTLYDRYRMLRVLRRGRRLPYLWRLREAAGLEGPSYPVVPAGR